MSEKEYPYGCGEKIIKFKITDKEHTDLLIRLERDKIKQTEFVRMIIAGYVDGDPRMDSFLDDYRAIGRLKKNENQVIGNERRKKEELCERFQLSDDDIDDIFDILREENEDL